MNGGERRRKLWEIRQTAETLRNAPIETPDFTKAILDRVDAERPFLAPSVRRKLPWIHMSIGLAVAVGVLAVALLRREAPSMIASSGPMPILNVVECVECAAAERVDTFKLSLVGPSAAAAEPTQLIELVATVAAVVESEGRMRDFDFPAPSILPRESMAGVSQAVAILPAAAPPAPVAIPEAASQTEPVVAMTRLRPAMYSPPSPAALRGLFAGALEPNRMRPTILENEVFSTIPPR